MAINNIFFAVWLSFSVHIRFCQNDVLLRFYYYAQSHTCCA